MWLSLCRFVCLHIHSHRHAQTHADTHADTHRHTQAHAVTHSTHTHRHTQTHTASSIDWLWRNLCNGLCTVLAHSKHAPKFFFVAELGQTWRSNGTADLHVEPGGFQTPQKIHCATGRYLPTTWLVDGLVNRDRCRFTRTNHTHTHTHAHTHTHTQFIALENGPVMRKTLFGNNFFCFVTFVFCV
jgi:hypothetical protein